MSDAKKLETKKGASRREECGYGKPPKAMQFKKGQSGNPSGRPKKAADLRSVCERELQRVVHVRQGDQLRKLTMHEAMVAALCASAARGNMRAFECILKIISAPKSIKEIMGGKSVFEWTSEERERFSEAKLLLEPEIDDVLEQ